MSTARTSSCPNLAAADMPPGLARVVEAWDSLPLHIRTSILALVDAVAPRQEGGGR
jgi:hypothetical protein